MFGSMLFIMLLGLPVAFSCGTVGVIFTALLQGPAAVNLVPTRIFGLMTNYLLAAIPLFILMACIAERGGLIADIYEAVYQWSGPLRGGVAHASIIACTMMAAMVGVIGASEVTMGLIALPEMLRRRYQKHMAIGSILAGGTLGILIPPSAMLIVYGMVDNSSIGQLYAGAFLPGFLLAGLFIAYVAIRCAINPTMGPPIPVEERLPLRRTGEETPAPDPHERADLPGAGDHHHRDCCAHRGGRGGGRRGLRDDVSPAKAHLEGDRAGLREHAESRAPWCSGPCSGPMSSWPST